MLRRHAGAVLGATLVALVLPPAAQAGAAPSAEGRYIVVLKDGADVSARAGALAGKHGGELKRTYFHALKGFSADLTAAEARSLTSEKDVAYVEQDRIVTASDTPDRRRPGAWTASTSATCRCNSTYTYNATGSRRARVRHRHRHPHHPHRVRRPRRARLRLHRRRQRRRRLPRPRHPRGRHRRRHAPTAWPRASSSTRCGCSTARAAAPTRGSSPASTGSPPTHVKPAVANMSLGGGASQAAGRRGDAAPSPPASPTRSPRATTTPTPAPARPPRVADAITVGATDSTDARASFSNYGTLRGPLRARLEHHLGLEHQRHRDRHHQRHLHGLPPRGRRRGALPRRHPTPPRPRYRPSSHATTGVVTDLPRLARPPALDHPGHGPPPSSRTSRTSPSRTPGRPSPARSRWTGRGRGARRHGGQGPHRAPVQRRPPGRSDRSRRSCLRTPPRRRLALPPTSTPLTVGRRRHAGRRLSTTCRSSTTEFDTGYLDRWSVQF